METLKRETKINFYLLATLMVTTPFTLFFTLPIAILLIVNLIVHWNWKERKARMFQNRLSSFFIVFISFYLIYLIGMLYTSNLKCGLSNLENKLWFLLAPMLLFSMDPQLFSKKIRQRLVLIFVFSTLAMALFNITYSLIEYLQYRNPFLFFYEKATHIPISLYEFKTGAPSWRNMHPTYLSMYVTFALVASLYYLYFSATPIRRWKRIVLIFGIGILFVYNYLLQSKAGIIILFFVILIAALYLINRIKIQILKSISFVLLLGGFVFLVMHYGSESMNRMAEAMKDLSNERTEEQLRSPIGSTSQRLVAWKIAFQQSVKHLPLGTGTGDAIDVMVEAYKEQGYKNLYDDRLNPHNQYLQTLLTVGIVGFGILILYFGYPFYHAFKRKKPLLLAFILIVTLNLMTESMFETGSGANFIAFFMCLLTYDSFVAEEE
ncbi:MAG: O-antigen ligase family protein [Bacteroidales bacterium]|nr:O-antigen ligase family protein [Bacteroidales bacterium]